MSIGCFMGIKSSYGEGLEDVAHEYVDAINAALKSAQLPAYADPPSPPDVYNDLMFGRSGLDHHSDTQFIELGEMAVESKKAPHLALLVENPYRVSFVPIKFPAPLRTAYKEEIFEEETQIWVGSAPALLEELALLAPLLIIPLTAGTLSDEAASQINEDSEDLPTAWLVLYEGARLAVKNNVAMSLAG